MRNWFTSLFWIPYDLWKDWVESSRLGMSEYDRESLRFWRNVGLAWDILKVLLFLGCLALAWWFSHHLSAEHPRKEPARASALKVRSDRRPTPQE